MGRGGFEPPKQFAADLQSVPFGHSGIHPYVKNIKLLGILLAVLVIFLGVRPLFTQTITNDSIASAIILVLIGIAYIVIVAKPQWAKAVFFFEGIIIGISGYTLLATPYNYLLGIIGLAIVVIAVLAYLQKLPMSILKYFYR